MDRKKDGDGHSRRLSDVCSHILSASQKRRITTTTAPNPAAAHMPRSRKSEGKQTGECIEGEGEVREK